MNSGSGQVSAALAQPAAATARTYEPGITVVVPTFQRAPLLRQCLESIVSQCTTHDRLVVVNDGSTDDTEQVAHSFGTGVSVLTRENGGFSRAANDGLDRVTTEYVWTFGDDDVMLPGAMERMRAVLDRDDGLEFCVGRWQRARRAHPTAKSRGYGAPQAIPDLSERGALPLLFESNYLNGGGLLARTRMLRALGGFDVRYTRSQDYHLAVRAALHHRFAVVPGGPVFLYTEHASPKGSVREPVPASVVSLKWLKFDQCIFHELVATLPDSAFAEPSVGGDIDAGLTLINRARAAASKLLNVQAIDALVTRCTRFPTVPLSPLESVRLEELPFLGHWYGLGSLSDDSTFWRAVSSLPSLGLPGAQMRTLLERGRSSRFRRSLRALQRGY